MKKIYLLGLLGLGLFGSCSNEELTNGSQPTKGNYTIEATIGDVQTRTSVDENFNVQWNKEDQIGVYGKTATNVLFTLTGDGGTATGQFTGTFNDTPTYAYYPYSADASIADKALTMTLLDSYSYTGDSNGPMIGKYSNGEITFKHLCGLLKVSINNIPSTATKFVLEGSSAIAGKATVADITAANAVLTLSQTENETSKKVTVSLSEAAITNKEFYFPLPTGTYETLKVSLQNANSEVLYEKTSSNVVITRAGAVDMPMLDASIACLQEIAKSGGTYTLVSDMTGDITISAKNPVIINLNGHTITNKSGDTFTVNNGSTLTINGEGKVDNVTHAKACIYNKGQTTISGGTFTGELYLSNETDATNASFSITGGTFSDPSALAYLAQKANVKILLNADKTAKGFKTQDGQTVEIDLGTHTLTLADPTVGSAGTETNSCQLLKGSVVTFKNGKIQSENNNIVIQNYSKLLLENVTVEATKADYVISNNNESCTINNSTITASSGKCAFDVYSFSTYAGVTVTVNTGSTINGKVEFGGNNNKKNGKLIINGGTFNGDLSVTEGYYDSANPNIIINGGNFGSHTGWSTYQSKK